MPAGCMAAAAAAAAAWAGCWAQRRTRSGLSISYKQAILTVLLDRQGLRNFRQQNSYKIAATGLCTHLRESSQFQLYETIKPPNNSNT
jgi:hypothetical protein